jgi:hypothetical protein
MASVKLVRSTLGDVVLRNNRKVIDLLQGKESAVKTAVPKRVLSFRTQICLVPYLQANEVGLPFWWSKYLHFLLPPHETQLRLLNTRDVYTHLPDEVAYELIGQRIIVKRDPIIHPLAFCTYDRVFFHNESLIKVGAESLQKMAADFDGDTYIMYIVNCLKAIYEMDFNVSPRFDMVIHGQSRINMIESIVLAMYRRNITNKIPYSNLYDNVRRRSIYKWLSSRRNLETLKQIVIVADSNQSFNNNTLHITLNDLYKMVEPTDQILTEMLIILNALYGSQESHRFYCKLLRLTMELSIKFDRAQLYQENLPCDYTMTDNLINFNLLAASFSGAKGSIQTYKCLLDKIYERDQHTCLIDKNGGRNVGGGGDGGGDGGGGVDGGFDYEKLIREIEKANKFAAKKSHRVPRQSTDLFNNSIEGDMIGYGRNCLNFDDTILIANIHLYMPSHYILQSSVAHAILNM